MKILRSKDFILALFFGIFIFWGFNIIQKNKTSNKYRVAKNQKHIETHQKRNEPSLSSFSNSPQKNKVALSKNMNNPTNTTDEISDSNEEFSSLDPNSMELPLSIEEQMDKKMEDFIINNLNYSFVDAEKVLSAKSKLQIQMFQYERMKEETGVSPQADLLNQKALADYQEELISILGGEGYQKFSQWKSKTEEELVNNYPGS